LGKVIAFPSHSCGIFKLYFRTFFFRIYINPLGVHRPLNEEAKQNRRLSLYRTAYPVASMFERIQR